MAYGGPVHVAAVQLRSTLDVEGNRRLAVEAIAMAAERGAALAVLPEATMCTFGEPSFDLAAVAERLDGPFVGALSEAADRHGIVVVAGMFEPGPEPGRVYNTAVAVGPDGLLGAYRKIHLYDALGAQESARVAPGPSEPGNVVVVDLGELRLGLMTCYDLRFPEMARALVDAGATVLALPAHWYDGPGKAEVWETLVRARAIESTAYVVAAGKPQDEAVGRSMVVDPAGEVLAALGGKEEGVAVADVTAQRLAEVRAVLPVLEHRRFAVRPVQA
jgi:deaminated glutathione amidase